MQCASSHQPTKRSGGVRVRLPEWLARPARRRRGCRAVPAAPAFAGPRSSARNTADALSSAIGRRAPRGGALPAKYFSQRSAERLHARRGARTPPRRGSAERVQCRLCIRSGRAPITARFAGGRVGTRGHHQAKSTQHAPRLTSSSAMPDDASTCSVSTSKQVAQARPELASTKQPRTSEGAMAQKRGSGGAQTRIRETNQVCGISLSQSRRCGARPLMAAAKQVPPRSPARLLLHYVQPPRPAALARSRDRAAPLMPC